MGLSAVVRHGAVHIVVTARTGPHFAPQLFQAAGFDPFAASVVVAKSPCGFRAAYQDRARQILVVRAPAAPGRLLALRLPQDRAAALALGRASRLDGKTGCERQRGRPAMNGGSTRKHKAP